MSIEPALSPEQWARKEVSPDNYWGEAFLSQDGDLGVRSPDNTLVFKAKHQHGLAALCMHEQPHGFTRHDASLHRGYADALRKQGGATSVVEDWHDSMADRIESYLPPVGM